jgi:mRNA-degrading endonuclease RelE of RelBE toxin-antitoxin system
MKGSRDCRLRVGKYRVIYQGDIDENTIFLLTVGHRRDIYRDVS